MPDCTRHAPDVTETSQFTQIITIPDEVEVNACGHSVMMIDNNSHGETIQVIVAHRKAFTVLLQA